MHTVMIINLHLFFTELICSFIYHLQDFLKIHYFQFYIFNYFLLSFAVSLVLPSSL